MKLHKSLSLLSAVAAATFAGQALAAPIIVDVSATSSPGNRAAVSTLDGSQSVAYNEIAAGSTTAGYEYRNTIANLVDTSGTSTGITLNVLDLANKPTVGSTTSSSTDFTGSPGASLFSAGMMQSFIAVYNTTRNLDYGLTGLDANATYDFDFLCNRNGTAGTTVITLAGATSTVGSIAASNNTSLLSFTGIAPDANGQIIVYVSSSPAPSTTYSPINVFQFEQAVPEPASLALISLGSLLMFRRRKA